LSDPRSCSNCGALAPSASARQCEFCGSGLPVEERAPAAPPSPFGDLAARFEELERHANMPLLQAHEPEIGKLVAGNTCGVIFLVLWTTMAGFMSLGFLTVFPCMAVVPIGMTILGGFLLSRMLKRTASLKSSPTLRRLALVVDERTSVSGGGNSSATTSHFATLEIADGSRQEYETHDQLAGMLTPGDMGMAYFRGGLFIDFKRVRV